jgi:hypothetical protein
MRHGSTLLASLLLSAPAAAADWSCSNRDLAEIRCGADSCEIERESFTPMELSLAPGRVEVCAFSGCFPGRVTLKRTAGPHILFHAIVRLGGANQPLAVILDTSTGTALMRWNGFANVMRCERAGTGQDSP